MIMKSVLAFAMFAIVSGCTSWTLPSTQGDPQLAEPYGYNPIDSLPVQIIPSNVTNRQKLDALPDETMRLAIGRLDKSVGLTYGPVSIGTAGNTYVVILDYTKFTTNPVGVKIVRNNEKIGIQLHAGSHAEATIPVYIGVGLRLTANVFVKKGSVDLGNLFSLGAAAQAEQISGTLVIQTLGLSGERVSPHIPIPSEINPTTIENALQAIGAIKATLYDERIHVVPRVVGVYNNLGGGQRTINQFISEILMNPPVLEVHQKPRN